MKALLIACVVLGVAAALPSIRQRRDSSPLFYNLPSNASLILGGINTGFECGDLPYGYYADEANNCAIYHVCLPFIEHNVYITRQFAFMCAPGSIFDQERLACTRPEFARPCTGATEYRSSNGFFGRSDVNFLEE